MRKITFIWRWLRVIDGVTKVTFPPPDEINQKPPRKQTQNTHIRVDLRLTPCQDRNFQVICWEEPAASADEWSCNVIYLLALLSGKQKMEIKASQSSVSVPTDGVPIAAMDVEARYACKPLQPHSSGRRLQMLHHNQYWDNWVASFLLQVWLLKRSMSHYREQ